ncbi:MAG: hypothetical protein LBB73_05545 [Dysgonamonadaceae bacterium]|nr:hypothetical protein [Dysgonamonadaceae bacterium]
MVYFPLSGKGAAQPIRECRRPFIVKGPVAPDGKVAIRWMENRLSGGWIAGYPHNG